jgi:hypothetical protein
MLISSTCVRQHHMVGVGLQNLGDFIPVARRYRVGSTRIHDQGSEAILLVQSCLYAYRCWSALTALIGVCDTIGGVSIIVT